MKISIIVPSGDMLHADFAFCLANLVRYTSHELMLVNPKSSLVQKGRYDGVQEALQRNPDAILFIDSDQTFQPFALDSLIKHRLPIVGASCRQRLEKGEYTARDKAGKRIDMTRQSGVIEVYSNGFPFCLIASEVFRKVPEPWFKVTFKNGWVSEDENFCHEARKAGYKIYVDTSIKIGHIGQKVY